jgi:hypothetical protein
LKSQLKCRYFLARNYGLVPAFSTVNIYCGPRCWCWTISTSSSPYQRQAGLRYGLFLSHSSTLAATRNNSTSLAQLCEQSSCAMDVFHPPIYRFPISQLLFLDPPIQPKKSKNSKKKKTNMESIIRKQRKATTKAQQRGKIHRFLPSLNSHCRKATKKKKGTHGGKKTQ